MKITMISNYINHHQIPFSNALYENLGENYHFIQTEPMEEERIQMGWGVEAEKIPYVVFLDKQLELCKQLIDDNVINLFSSRVIISHDGLFDKRTTDLGDELFIKIFDGK